MVGFTGFPITYHPVYLSAPKAYNAGDIPREVAMRRIVFLFALLLALIGCQQDQKPAEQPAQQPAAATTPVTTPAPAATPAPASPTPGQQGKPASVAATKAPPAPATPPAKPLVLADSPLGPVTFDHGKHKLECKTCHHESRPQKPATAAQQACRDCHTKPAQPGMTTVRQAAFHNPSATAGTCIDCHKQKGGNAPTACKQCHVKS